MAKFTKLTDLKSDTQLVHDKDLVYLLLGHICCSASFHTFRYID